MGGPIVWGVPHCTCDSIEAPAHMRWADASDSEELGFRKKYGRQAIHCPRIEEGKKLEKLRTPYNCQDQTFF